MPDSRAVGFSFQADVVNTASLAHLLTGRVLKAMSDGGVDVYAVTVSMCLGNLIPIQPSLESAVFQHIRSLKSCQGIVAKALSIGWGHSLIPCEMSRTKAGTSLLLLVGALATGSNAFSAAHCLSELLTLSGCEPGSVPNIDVLKNMITYLAPFVQELGFCKVLEHVTTTCQKQILQSNKDEAGLVACGDSPVLAGAIHQLCLTAKREESIYLIVRQRGAWIASFASYLLGLSVEVLLEDTVLWASAGSSGKVSLQLAPGFTSSGAVQLHGRHTLTLVPEPSDPSGRTPLVIYYDPAMALDAELSQIPEIPASRYAGIQTAIARLCLAVLEKLCVAKPTPGLDSTQSSTLPSTRNRLLSSQPTIRLLSAFGIPDQLIEIGKKDFRTYESRNWDYEDDSGANGLYYLDSDQKSWLKSVCPSAACIHLVGSLEVAGCLCARVGHIIGGFASTIIALGQCVADVKDLRLRADVLNGSVITEWSRELLLSASVIHDLIGHLGQLVTWSLSDVDGTIERSSQGDNLVLGVSADAHTITYTALLGDEAFDDHGRLLTITSGRATVDGLFRNYLIERKIGFSSSSEDTPSLLAHGSLIEPYYYPGRLRVWIETGVIDEGILVGAFLGHSEQSTRISLVRCAESMKYIVVPRCEHPKSQPYRVPHSQHQSDTGQSPQHLISPFSYGPANDSGIMIFPLTGNRLQQLIQCGTLGLYLRRQGRSVILQMHSCISCAVRMRPEPSCVILGG